MTHRRAVLLIWSLAALLAAGCGGGGGSSGTNAGGNGAVASTSAFPLQNGYRARVTAGASDNFTISGTCAGNAQIVNGMAAPAMFEGVAGFSATQSATVNFTNCLPLTSTASGVNYFDANYTPIGASVTGVEYAAFTVLPTALPTAAKVGDGAVIVTFTTYRDNTKALVTGQRVLSYVIEADTAGTVIANIVAKTYDGTNQLLLTQQTRYRVAADGTLTVVSIDVQYSTTSNVHLVYTKV